MFAKPDARWPLILPIAFVIAIACLASPVLARPSEQGLLSSQDYPIVKLDLADPVPIDGLVTYSIEVGPCVVPENMPPEDWLGLRWSVEDVLPAGLQYVSSSPAGIYDAGQHRVRWELGGLLPGATRTLLITLRPNPDVILETMAMTNRAEFWQWKPFAPTATPTRPINCPPQLSDRDVPCAPPDAFAKPAAGRWLTNATPASAPAAFLAEPTGERRLMNETSETTTIVVPEREPPALVAYGRILQQGKDNYIGNTDVYINRDYPTRNYAHTPWMYLKTIDSTSVLSRFDLTGLPAGAQITKAILRFYFGATAPINAPITLQLYELLGTWDEDGATWTQAQTDMLWVTPGANGDGDRDDLPGAAVDCYAPPLSYKRLVEFDVTALAQGWLAMPASNFGIVVKPTICRGTSLYYIYSADSRVPERRPELYLEYMAPPAP